MYSFEGGAVFARVALIIALALASAGRATAADCPDRYDFADTTIDYYDPDPGQQGRIRGIESNHMNQDVRSLRRGQSTANASGDLRFVIGIIPNHPTALELVMRMAQRDRTDKLPEMQPYVVECWLHRATVFRPNDGTALMLYGIYLARRGRLDSAIEILERANTARPEDINITYNLGLLHFEKKDYQRSREFAKKAYAGGFSLPGLKKKLQQAGEWRD